MLKIRQGIFETNSSSTHSLVVYSGGGTKALETLYPDENGVLNIPIRCWNQYPSNPQEKASYCYSLAVSSDNEPKLLALLNKVLKEHTAAKEVNYFIDPAYRKCAANNVDINGFGGDDGYFESDEEDEDNDYSEFCSTPFQSKEFLKNFIFNPNSSIDMEVSYDG